MMHAGESYPDTDVLANKGETHLRRLRLCLPTSYTGTTMTAVRERAASRIDSGSFTNYHDLGEAFNVQETVHSAHRNRFTSTSISAYQSLSTTGISRQPSRHSRIPSSKIKLHNHRAPESAETYQAFPSRNVVTIDEWLICISRHDLCTASIFGGTLTV